MVEFMPFDHSSVEPVSQLSHYLAGHFGGIKQALATTVAYAKRNENARVTVSAADPVTVCDLSPCGAAKLGLL